MDLTNLTFRFAFGNLDIYGYGCLRIGVARNTGEIVISYVV